MKERSVLFYKRVIIITALSILIILAGIITFCVGHALELWDDSVGQNSEYQGAGTNGALQVSGTLTEDNLEKVKPDGVGDFETEKNQNDADGADAEDLYVTKAAINPDVGGKVVYLTFDDGASVNTPEILKILEAENVPATFFFNTNERQTSDSIIKQAYDQGNGIGVLTSTGWNYRQIYESVDSYLNDFNEAFKRISEITGEKPQILRFPGGSINAYNKNNYGDFVNEITERGFVYFDWNVCAQDSSAQTSKSQIVQNATKLPKNYNKCIVLMHDNGNNNTCEALKEIISFYRENGYSFQKLSPEVEPITF